MNKLRYYIFYICAVLLLTACSKQQIVETTITMKFDSQISETEQNINGFLTDLLYPVDESSDSFIIKPTLKIIRLDLNKDSVYILKIEDSKESEWRKIIGTYSSKNYKKDVEDTKGKFKVNTFFYESTEDGTLLDTLTNYEKGIYWVYFENFDIADEHKERYKEIIDLIKYKACYDLKTNHEIRFVRKPKPEAPKEPDVSSTPEQPEFPKRVVVEKTEQIKKISPPLPLNLKLSKDRNTISWSKTEGYKYIVTITNRNDRSVLYQNKNITEDFLKFPLTNLDVGEPYEITIEIYDQKKRLSDLTKTKAFHLSEKNKIDKGCNF